MDCLECKVCNIPYDKQNHKPRHATCGHEVCSACITVLIRGSIYCCPTCREITLVNNPTDLPVSFGLMDVIRAFKSKNIDVKSVRHGFVLNVWIFIPKIHRRGALSRTRESTVKRNNTIAMSVASSLHREEVLSSTSEPTTNKSFTNVMSDKQCK